MINPDYLEPYIAECSHRNVQFSEATEEYDYIDLDVDEDFVEKASAIIAGEEYDEKITVPLTLSDADMLQLCMLAHEADVTLNEYVTTMLKEFIKERSKND